MVVKTQRTTMGMALARALGVLVLSLSASSGCDSKTVDGGELHDVFNSAKVRATASGAPSSSAAAAPTTQAAVSASASANAAPSIAPLVRDPVAGVCLEKSGEAEPITGRVGRRPGCRGANVLEHKGPLGAPRYACVFAPRGASERAPLPLLLFFHDLHDTPTAVHKKTHLRKHYRKYDLSGDPAHAGFIVLAPQSRRLKGMMRFETAFHSDDNADVQAVDKFVAQLIEQGLVDTRRVYALGHGVGGDMAAMYSMLRPGRVAAFATFGSASKDFRWSCDAPAPPAAIVYRACDTITPCAETEQWLAERERLNAPTLSMRLGINKREAASCSLAKRSCRDSSGRNNHVRWPRGRETDILDYLARYSLRLPATASSPQE